MLKKNKDNKFKIIIIAGPTASGKSLLALDLAKKYNGIIINAGALTHYGLSLKDALLDASLPIIEVHISNVHSRESYRRDSVIATIAMGQIIGVGTKGYTYALEAMHEYLENN